MIIIRFKDAKAEERAIGYLTGRFPGKSYANGETLVPEAALAHLAVEGIEHQYFHEQFLPRLVGHYQYIKNVLSRAVELALIKLCSSRREEAHKFLECRF